MNDRAKTAARRTAVLVIACAMPMACHRNDAPAPTACSRLCSAIVAAESASDFAVPEGAVDLDCDCGDAAPGFSPLTLASSKSSLAVVRGLLAAGATPDRPDSQGESALESAIHTERSDARDEIIRALVEAGADPNATLGGLAHLEQAILAQNGSVRALLEAGADPNHYINETYGLALDMARGTDTATLLEFGADPNRPMDSAEPLGDTPFSVAVFRGQIERVRLMLQHGARLTLPDGREVETIATNIESASRRAAMLELLESARRDG